MNEYEGHWITTYSGRKFHYLNPSSDEICIEDIAHALALTCRFGGHCKTFYSVAEHSYRVAMLVPDNDKCAALLHDAHEAYLHDVPRPIKQDIIGYKLIADKIQDKIHDKFSVTVHNPTLLKYYDDVLLSAEARDIMVTTQDWEYLPNDKLLEIKPTNWQMAEKIFLDFWEDYDD